MRKQDDSRHGVFFRCSERTYRLLKDYAKEEELPLGAAIIQLCKEAIARREQELGSRS